MSFFNLISSCIIFVSHFINCFNCCIYEWHSWQENLKKLKLGNRGVAYKVPLSDQPFNLKKWGLWFYHSITVKSHFSEKVLPCKLLELTRKRRKFNIIITIQIIFNNFPYKIILWWKKTIWKEIFNCSYFVASLLNL